MNKNDKKIQERKFQIVTKVNDTGQAVIGLLVDMIYEINQKDLNKDDFLIHAYHKYEQKVIIDRNVNIKQVFVLNNQKQITKQGKYIFLECEPVGTLYWNEDTCSNYPMELEYSLIQKNQACFVKYKMCLQRINLIVDQFGKKTSTSGLNYRIYEPQNDGKSKSLIVWLHGAGAGGQSNETQITGNRGAVAFAKKEVQCIFDGAYVIAPQAPDYWMNEFMLGSIMLKGHDYTKQIIDLIKEVLRDNPLIDPLRIYIGGCSMGGYQTWKTLLMAPSMFAAAFPICAAYLPTVEELKTIQHMPIWLTHAKSDDIVSVENSQQAYQRLKIFNKKVIYSEYENVYFQGKEYPPHFSWIYVLNNVPQNEQGIHFFNWLAQQKKYD